MFSNHNGMKIEIINRKAFGKFTIICKLNNTLIIINESKKTSQGKLLNTFEMNTNENMTYQNVHVAVKAVLREKFLAVDTHIKKKISNQ